MVDFKNFSSDGVERNRKFSAYKILKMETGCIDLEVRYEILSVKLSRAAKGRFYRS